ncbi:MAG: DMT family transporter [Chitinophagales bacterium]
MKDRDLGVLFLILAFFMAGSSVVAARYISYSLGPFTIAAVSLLIATLSLIPFCVKQLKEVIPALKLGDWSHLCLQALCGIFLFRVFMLYGLQCTTAAETGIITGTAPAITALMAYVFLREPISKYLFGIISTVAGILLMQGMVIINGNFTVSHLTGNLMVMAAVASESTFDILSRRHSLKSAGQKLVTIDPLTQSALVTAIAFLLCLVPALHEGVSPLTNLGPKVWLALIWYGTFVTALGYIFWYAGIKRCKASTAAVASGFMPLTALILSVLLLGESPGWWQWAGGAMVITGMLSAGKS